MPFAYSFSSYWGTQTFWFPTHHHQTTRNRRCHPGSSPICPGHPSPVASTCQHWALFSQRSKQETTSFSLVFSWRLFSQYTQKDGGWSLGTHSKGEIFSVVLSQLKMFPEIPLPTKRRTFAYQSRSDERAIHSSSENQSWPTILETSWHVLMIKLSENPTFSPCGHFWAVTSLLG